MARRTLISIFLALCALVALPALASGQDFGSLFEETEPATTIDKVKVSKRGVVKTAFSGTDPVDAPEVLTFDCLIDAGGNDADEEEDEGDDEDAFSSVTADNAGASEIECTSPWTVKELKRGWHTVEVIAFDEEWNEDPTPATAQFKVKKKK